MTTTAPSPAPASVASPPGTARQHSPARTALLLGAVVVVLLIASLLIGTRALSPSQVFDALVGRGAEDVLVLVRDYRLPRGFIALVVGACLGVAGALIQALTRNPLADPGILGVNAGAAFAVTVTVAVLGQLSMTVLAIPAMIGACVTTVAVLALGAMGRGPSTPVRMTLSGVAIAAVLGGVSTGLRLLDAKTFEQLRAWAAGSVAGRGLDDLAPLLPLVVLGLLIAVAVARPMNALALGDDRASSLGVNVRAVRITTVIAVTLLCGSATAIAGPIGFIGLMVPHAVRWWVGPNNRAVVVLSAIGAAALLLASDVLSRVLLSGREVPVGIVTAFVGAPILIALVRQPKVTEL